MKPRILITASTLTRWHGDTEPRFIADFAKSLSDRYELHLLAPWHPGAQKTECVDGYTIHRFQYWFTAGPQLAGSGGMLSNLQRHRFLWLAILPYLLLQLMAIFRITRRHDIRLIHSHWVIPQGLVALLAKLLSKGGIRYIVTLHGGDHYVFNQGILGKLKHLILRNACAITVVSNTIMRDLISVDGKLRVTVAPMGVNLAKSFCIKNPQHKRAGIIFVGRLVEKKGVKYLIKALAILRDRGTTLQLTIAGSGPQHDELVSMTHRLQLDKQVRFMGFIPHEELPALLNRHSISVVPSIVNKQKDQEGFGLVVVEAMGCGCAVVVTDLPAFSDTVIPDKTGLIVRQQDAQDLADTLQNLYTNLPLKVKLSNNARDFIQTRYDWRTASKVYHEIYSAHCKVN